MKFIATILSFILGLEVAMAPLGQASAWAALQGQSLHAVEPAPVSSSLNLSFPRSLATVVETHIASPSSRLVFHIQDIHDSLPAQTNLSAIVGRMAKAASDQSKALVVAVEGSSGKLNSDAVASLTDQAAKEDVGAALLKTGVLLGEEYAAITMTLGAITLIGVESPDLFQKNTLAKTESKFDRERALSALRDLERRLFRLVPHTFNGRVESLMRARSDVSRGTLSLADYLKHLRSIAPAQIASYDKLSALISAARIGEQIDPQKIKTETEHLVASVSQRLRAAELDRLSRQASEVQDGRMSPQLYYGELLKKASGSFPAINSYLSYLALVESSQTEMAMDQLDRVEEEIAESLISHPHARDLYRHLRWVENQIRLVDLSLIPQEWARFENVDADQIAHAWDRIEAFLSNEEGDLTGSARSFSVSGSDYARLTQGARFYYQSARARDGAMAQNFERVLASYPADRFEVAFVAGGFHTPGLTKALRTAGRSYRVIRPQLDTSVKLSEKYPVPARQTLRQPGGLSTAAGVDSVVRAVETGNPGAAQPISSSVLVASGMVLTLAGLTAWSAGLTWGAGVALAGLAARYGFKGAVIAGPLQEVKKNPNINPPLVQLVEAADKIFGIKAKYDVRPGLLGEANVELKRITLGASLLTSHSAFSTNIKGLFLAFVLGHEYMHVRIPQTRSNLLNEAAAYLAGIPAGFFLLINFLFVPLLSRSPRETHLARALRNVISASESQVKRFQKAAKAVINSSQDQGAVFVAVDVASLFDANTDPGTFARQMQEALQILMQFRQEKQSHGLTAHLLFYNSNPELKPIESQLNINLGRDDNFTYTFVGADRASNLRVLTSEMLIGWGVPSGSAARFDQSNTYILSRRHLFTRGVQAVSVHNIPHLSLAMFAYSHFTKAETVLVELVALFKKFFDVQLDRSIEQKLQNETLAALAA